MLAWTRGRASSDIVCSFGGWCYVALRISWRKVSSECWFSKDSWEALNATGSTPQISISTTSNSLKKTFINYLSVCIHIHASQRTYVEVKEQVEEVHFLFPPSESQGPIQVTSLGSKHFAYWDVLPVFSGHRLESQELHLGCGYRELNSPQDGKDHNRVVFRGLTESQRGESLIRLLPHP